MSEPRLLDVAAAAAYLGGIAERTVDGLIAAGHLRVVRLPSTRRPGEAARRVLIDRADLDAFIQKCKESQ